MPVYGLRIDKLIKGHIRSNRYFTNAATLNGALVVGTEVANQEKLIFGESVTITNVHAWVRNVSPNVFDNQPLNLPGDVDALAPVSPCIVGIIEMSIAGAYVNSKAYRMCLNANTLEGEEWSSGILVLLETLAAYLQGMSDNGDLCDKNGVAYTATQASSFYDFRQLGKRWYNRGSE